MLSTHKCMLERKSTQHNTVSQAVSNINLSITTGLEL